MAAWWETFFDGDYIRLWSHFIDSARTAREVDALWRICDLAPGRRVLDAPCGFGRIARGLAERGATVVGVDASQAQLDHAESTRGTISPESLRYVRHDLRTPLDVGGFDAALNLYSSIGYGTEDDDRAVLATLARAVKPGGFVVVETMHRDALAALRSRGFRPSARLDDGTVLIEEPHFDALRGVVETTWHWAGPLGSGSRPATVRVYTITEIARLMESVGITVRDVRADLSDKPYDATGEGVMCRAALVGVVGAGGANGGRS